MKQFDRPSARPIIIGAVIAVLATFMLSVLGGAHAVYQMHQIEQRVAETR